LRIPRTGLAGMTPCSVAACRIPDRGKVWKGAGTVAGVRSGSAPAPAAPAHALVARAVAFAVTPMNWGVRIAAVPRVCIPRRALTLSRARLRQARTEAANPLCKAGHAASFRPTDRRSLTCGSQRRGERGASASDGADGLPTASQQARRKLPKGRGRRAGSPPKRLGVMMRSVVVMPAVLRRVTGGPLRRDRPPVIAAP
jgi:hypothetical protein